MSRIKYDPTKGKTLGPKIKLKPSAPVAGSSLRERALKSRQRAEHERLRMWLYLVRSARRDEVEADRIESATEPPSV